jgi:ATP-dependent Lhr-like helicase
MGPVPVQRPPLAPFRPAVREWFESALGEPTRAQSLAFGPIARGESTLLLAPTGSGKTLAAFLAALDKLAFAPEPPREARCRVLYVSPLKALAVDIERNLRAPMAGILETARRRGDEARSPTVGVRTGDTAAIERTRMARTPPDILITTPESLYLVLTSSARELLAHVETVIVDEIHALAPSKRGAHLFLSLERLEALRAPEAGKLQRIGLSATQRPLEEIARLLGGFERGKPRPVTVVDAGHKKRLDLTIEVPDIDMARLGELDELASGPAAGGARRTIWPHVHARLVELVRAHKSTILFVNSRRLAERLAGAINEAAGEEIALAHHGSVAREQRAAIEDRLKRGLLPAIVATSSLELGIDMGAVDLVVQIESPPSVASGMQRIGRASHQVGGVPKGIILPKHRADLLAATAAAAGMRAGEVEETAYPRNPLDVLAQQIVATVAREPSTADALFELARRAAPFAELPRTAFEGVLDMLSGRYPSADFRDLRARVTWDRTRGKVSAREGAQRLAVTNGGTIPDRGLYGVFLRDSGASAGGAGGTGKASRRVGELDEEMVFELREGEVFLLGASSWRADEITRDRVIVTPAAGEPGKMPFWHGDRPGRPRAFGEAIGALTRRLARASDEEATRTLEDELRLDPSAARNLLAYVREQQSVTGEVPSDRAIVVERFRDELGDWRVCVLSPFGARVHAPWATVVLARLTERYAGDADAVWTDDGIAFRVPASDEAPDPATFFPPSADVESLVVQSLGHTSLFAARFREAAARALLLPRRSPGKRTPLWAQRKRAHDLLSVASQYPSFPIVLETYRECLRDVFDLPSLALILQRVESRRIRVTPCDSRVPSPFAASLLFSFVANFIYDGDAPLAERRAQALTIDHAQLRELLGESELRQLLDPDAIDAHVRMLQRLDRPAKHADGAHDLLLSLGDLSLPEIEERATPAEAAAGWMAGLERDRRVARVTIAGDKRFIASEDIGRYRDTLGIVPPRGVPDAFLEPVKDAWSDLVSRWARTHGPFTAASLVARFGAGADTIEHVVDRLVAAGKLVDGAFLRGGHGRELCDAEVLGAVRRKSLSKLRREVEPVEAAAYGRFVLEWQAVTNRRRGRDALLETVAQLQGCPLPASVLDARIFGARVEGFRAWDLDALCASGRVTWAGVEPLGPSDGRIALFLAEDEALLSAAPKQAEGELAAKLRALLERRGAIFFPEIAAAAGGYPAEALDALWSMVWAGEVTNDTLEPLRSLADAASGKDRPRGRAHRVAPRRSALPGSEGRWSLRAARLGVAPSETERRAALTRALLERYGVLTREAVHAEGIEGGFSAVYDVLKALEDAGRVRRGYFLAGRGATQFALPGADDRLRAMREPSETPRATILAATDPANPYGATLPWPTGPARGAEGESETRRPQRAAGALVILFDGALVGWLGRGADSLLTFLPADDALRARAAAALAGALAELVEAGERRALLLATIDGEPAAKSALSASLHEAGFRVGREGWLRRRSEAAAIPPGWSAREGAREGAREDVHAAEVDDEPHA